MIRLRRFSQKSKEEEIPLIDYSRLGGKRLKERLSWYKRHLKGVRN